MSTPFVIALTTLPAGQDPEAFARVLVDERLAACVNVLPEMLSIYRWQGAVEQDRERQLVIKTTRQQCDALWERIKALHSYDVPEFIVLPVVDGNDAYLRWITDSTGGAP
jgi:periplasmic divalent cation tolerance protein